jgi:hypothetical protein
MVGRGSGPMALVVTGSRRSRSASQRPRQCRLRKIAFIGNSPYRNGESRWNDLLSGCATFPGPVYAWNHHFFGLVPPLPTVKRTLKHSNFTCHALCSCVAVALLAGCAAVFALRALQHGAAGTTRHCQSGGLVLVEGRLTALRCGASVSHRCSGRFRSRCHW